MIRTIVVIASVAATLGVAAPAEARPAPTPLALSYPARPAPTRLVLSYLAEAGYAAAVKLTCDPPGGGHPRPADACRTLRRAGGRPDDIRAAPTMCMMIYAPITAEVTGLWRGGRIAWRHNYGNRCELNRATGDLFAF
ncbi:MAG: hypothetical protein QOH97_2827 [Actinoplanes sp.]|jgi:hypothetical protein|nr:hypothetical protein [Actinoplanes sp.]